MSYTKIGRHLNVSDAHESDAGVFDLPPDDVDKLLAEKLTNLARSSTHSSDLMATTITRTPVA